MDAFLVGLSTGLTWLLQSSWQGALLVVLIVAVQAGLRRRLSPQWRHALWGLLILRLLLVWAPPAPWSVYNVVGSTAPVAMYLAPAPELPATNSPLVEATAQASEVGLAESTPPQSRRDNRESTDFGNALGLRDAVALVWLGITGLLLGAMIYQTLRFGRHVRAGRLVTESATLDLLEDCRSRLGVSTYLAMVETDCVRSPALLGCIRPKLLLPRGFLADLSREEMRHVFLHELAHVKRGDIWSSWLMNLLAAAHWFNPLIWYARRRFIADREAACDAHVLAALDEPGQRAYGHTLLNLMQRFNATQWAPGIAGISENNSNLKRRILMIKHFRSPTRLAAWVGAGLCTALALVTLTNAQELARTPVEIVCEPSDILAYTAPNGGTMIAVQLTNTGPTDTVVEVEFWLAGADIPTKIGRGGLMVPAGKTATEAIPWEVENGRHSVAVQIDPDNTIAEVDEENNCVTAVILYKDGRFSQEPAPREERTASQGRRIGGIHTAGTRTGDTIVRKADAGNTDGSSAEKLRAQCQNNMKQLGLVFKMFANDSKGGVWAPLSREPGRLMFAWGGTNPTLGGMAVMSHEYMSQVSIAVCPRTEDASEIPDDTDYAYLGHLIRNEEDLLRFAEAYKEWAEAGGDEAKWFVDDTPRSPDTGIVRLREGIERFLITDINNPAGAAVAQSQIPVLIEWPDHHPTETGIEGGNVLYMDGHVEFVKYPGEWPMTETTIGILRELAGREPVGG